MNLLGEETTPILNTRKAGAGLIGIGFGFPLLMVGVLLYQTHQYFLAMLVFSFALVLFKVGKQIRPVLLYLWRVLYSEDHLEKKATDLINAQNWLKPLAMKFLATGEKDYSSISEARRTEVDQFIFSCLQGKHQDMSLEQVESVLENECLSNSHEGYQYVAQTFDFTAALMPLVGLVGTILEMTRVLDRMGVGAEMMSMAPLVGIAMKNTMYGALFAIIFKLLAVRFRLQIKTLEYDFAAIISLLKTLKKA